MSTLKFKVGDRVVCPEIPKEEPKKETIERLNVDFWASEASLLASKLNEVIDHINNQ